VKTHPPKKLFIENADQEGRLTENELDFPDLLDVNDVVDVHDDEEVHSSPSSQPSHNILQQIQNTMAATRGQLTFEKNTAGAEYLCHNTFTHSCGSVIIV